jgi:hypothetical protein
MSAERNRGFLRAQFTIAYWYIDRANTSAPATRRYYLRHARLAYEIIGQLLPAMELSAVTRERLYRELSSLKDRIGSSQSAPELLIRNRELQQARPHQLLPDRASFDGPSREPPEHSQEAGDGE